LDAVLAGQLQGHERRGQVAGVPAAGDVGGGDHRHQLGVVGAALAQVAVEIDVHRSLLWPAGLPCPLYDRRPPAILVALARTPPSTTPTPPRPPPPSPGGHRCPATPCSRPPFRFACGHRPCRPRASASGRWSTTPWCIWVIRPSTRS